MVVETVTETVFAEDGVAADAIVVETVSDAGVTVVFSSDVTVKGFSDQVSFVEVVEVVAQQGRRGLQGIPGPAGGSLISLVAGENLSGQRAIRVSEGLVWYCDAQTPDDAGKAVGVNVGAALAGAEVLVKTLGDMTEPGWSFSEGPVYVGDGGTLTQTTTSQLSFVQQIGVATGLTTLFINPQQAILRL